MEAKISVIIPIYNTAEYLDECITSIVNQTFKNIEIILIDDGSTDCSSSICKRWQEKDKRIKYYQKENGGVSSARNLGLSVATGNFIAFVDADDYISHDIYQELYTLIEQYNCDLAICGRTRVFNDKIEKYPNTNIEIFNNGKVDINKMGCQFDLNISVNKLYKKEIFKSLRFPTTMSYAEDLYIVPDILSQTKKIVYTSKGLYFYVERKNSASFTLNEKKLWNDIEAKNKFYHFMLSKGVDTKTPFNWLFGSYVRGYQVSKNKRNFTTAYIKFFFINIHKCLFKIKCILFLFPKFYFYFKKHE